MKGLSYESVLWLSVLSLPPLPFSSSLLLRLPTETTEAPFHLRRRRPTLTSSLKSPNRIERDSIKRRDERCVARGGEEGGRASTVENTRLGRMLLSLSCCVNR